MSVETLLQDWGDWNRRDIDLGYPSSSSHTKAFDGGYGTKQGISQPPHIEEVDLILRDLKAYKPRQYEAISLTYITNVPGYKLGYRMKLPRDKAKSILDRALGFVEGKIATQINSSYTSSKI